MGVDYRVEVYRKEDDRKIAEFLCNHFKCIFESTKSGFEELDRFTYEDIVHMEKEIRFEIAKKVENERYLKDSIPKCVSREVKCDMEEDLRCNSERVEELESALMSCHVIMGYMQAFVEDMISRDDWKTPAYEYNSEGLKERTTLWVGDVYCRLVADY